MVLFRSAWIALFFVSCFSASEAYADGTPDERINLPPIARRYSPLENPPSEGEVTSPNAQDPSLRWPEFRANWGLRQSIYAEAQVRYQELFARIQNRRYVVVIDFSKHSSRNRFFLFDLLEGTVEPHLTAHGKGSDPKQSGIPTKFSNIEDSHMSSLGAYITLGTYMGGKGYSLQLSGVDPTNDLAEERAIVVHPASYVREEKGTAGVSWGCPALDPDISTSVIDKIKDGALLYIGTK